MATPKKRVPKIIELFHHKLGWEGFLYCIRDYSDWKEVKRVDPILYQMIVDVRGPAKDRKFKPGSILKHLRDKYNLGAPVSPMAVAAQMGIRL